MKPPHSVMSVRPDKFAVICGWCTTKLAGDQWAESRGYSISHSICPACAKNMAVEKAAESRQLVRVKMTEEQLLKILNNDNDE